MSCGVAWLVYLGVMILVNVALISFLNPKWGKKVVFIPVTITASVGSITVMTAKGLGYLSNAALLRSWPTLMSRYSSITLTL